MLAAVSVTVAMRTVGLLLVSALMVVPVATSQQLTRSFRTTLAAAMVLGTLASVGGLLLVGVRLRRRAGVAPGPTIVLLALAGFVGRLAGRRLAAVAGAGCAQPFPVVAGRPRTTTTDEHPHEHGEDCGHVAVRHGDHVDYVHDGHRHAAAREAL